MPRTRGELAWCDGSTGIRQDEQTGIRFLLVATARRKRLGMDGRAGLLPSQAVSRSFPRDERRQVSEASRGCESDARPGGADAERTIGPIRDRRSRVIA